MAAAIKKATGVDADLVKGDRGEFTIWVDETKIAEKDPDLGFPAEDEVVADVQRALL